MQPAWRDNLYYKSCKNNRLRNKVWGRNISSRQSVTNNDATLRVVSEVYLSDVRPHRGGSCLA